MGQALFHPSRIAVGRTAEPRPLPVGVGLAIGGCVSLGLWAGLVWLALRLLI